MIIYEIEVFETDKTRETGRYVIECRSLTSGGGIDMKLCVWVEEVDEGDVRAVLKKETAEVQDGIKIGEPNGKEKASVTCRRFL